MEILFEVDETRQVGLGGGRVTAQFGAKGAIGFLLTQPVLRARADQFHAVFLTGLDQQVPQVILHLDRVVQLPTQFTGIGDADRIYRTHAQFDLARRQPGKPFVGQGRFGVGIDDDILQHVTRFRPGDGKNAPLRGHVLDFDIAEFLHLVVGGFAQIIGVIFCPSPCGDKIIAIFTIAHDRIFRACGAMGGQRIGQIDPANARQLVAGEPVQELRRAGAFDHVFGKGCRINQANAFAHGFGLDHRVLPPTAAPEAARVMVVEPCGGVIIRAFPAIDPAKLRAFGGLAVIGGRCAQRTRRRAFFVRVVQNIDVVVTFFVLAGGEFRRHPARGIAFRVKAGHVDFRFAIDHHLGQIITGATCRCDAKAEAFGQPHVAQTRRGADQRVAIGRITNRTVEIVLQPTVFAGRYAVDHRHVLIFDPVQRQREQVGAETVGHTMFEHRRGVFFVHSQDPAATFFAHIALCVGIADDRVFRVARSAICFQCRVDIGNDELVFHGDCRDLNAQHLGGALRVVARGRHDMFGGDHNGFIRGHQIAALFHHLGAGDLPMGASPVERVCLQAAHDLDAALTRALGHGLCHIGGINVSIFGVIQRALQVVGLDQRPTRLDLIRGQEFIVDAHGVGG